MYNQHYLTPFIYNPSLTGASGNSNLFLIHKGQWTGMPGGPLTNSINFDGAFGKNKKAGLGVSLFSDKTDIINRVGGYVSYAYKLKLNEDHNFLLGLGVGVMNTRIDFDRVIVKDQNDQSLYTQIQSKATLDANVGLSYNWKRLQIGFAVPQVFSQRVNYQNENTISTYYGLARHFIGTAKYEFLLMNDDISLTPLAMVRFMPATPIQYEGHIYAKYKDFVGLGVAYKSNYAVAVSAMVKPHKNFTVAYSYDFIVNNLSNYARISHEVILGYTFGNKNDERIKKLEEQMIDVNDHLIQSDSISQHQEDRIDTNAREIEGLKQGIKSLENEIDILEDSIKEMSKDMFSMKELAAMNDEKRQEWDDNRAANNGGSNNGVNNGNKSSGNNNGSNSSGNTNGNNSSGNNNGSNSSGSTNGNNSSGNNGSNNNNNSNVNSGSNNQSNSTGNQNDGNVRSGEAKDYVDENGEQLKPGGYVVVGVFAVKDNATRYRAKLNSSMMILNKVSTLHYIFTKYDPDYTQLMGELENARNTIDGNSWILKIK